MARTERQVVLHVGHGKTGTSALQSWCAAQQDNLANAGILYPDLVDLSEAKQGKISNGNGGPLARAVRVPRDGEPEPESAWLSEELERITPYLDRDASIVLISSETFQRLDPQRLAVVVSTFSERGYQTRAVGFLRNYAEFFFSVYLQHVKRGQNTQSFKEFMSEKKDYLWDLVERLDEVEHCDFSFELYNFADAKGDIVTYFLETVLGVDPKKFPVSEHSRVNRSITAREKDFLQMINRVFDHNTMFRLADRLVYASPDLEFAHGPSSEDLECIKELAGSSIDRINSRVQGTPISIAGPLVEDREDEQETLYRVLAILFRFIDEGQRECRSAHQAMKSRLESGFDQVSERLHRVEEEHQRLQKLIESQRKDLG